ncbi:transcription factor iie-like protein [Dermatophagoides farinae]|uniref:Transcription factor iie-like protein n=1 Tax=Dermatophagoides farinae TaxID=6954 RepID=A0A9D4P948_DERFA|nr:transcription factor iie-like protein [Dermatophagoides farinae]
MNDDPMNQNGNNNINVDMNFFNHLPFIRVNGHLVSLIDLSDEHIVKMNDMEKQDYIRTAQQLYATVFDI